MKNLGLYDDYCSSWRTHSIEAYFDCGNVDGSNSNDLITPGSICKGVGDGGVFYITIGLGSFYASFSSSSSTSCTVC